MTLYLRIAGLLLMAFLSVSCSTSSKPEALVLSKFNDSYKGVQSDKASTLSLGSLKGFLVKGHAEKQTGIYLTEAYDPKKIPVLFIHGLLSEPSTWEDMAHTLKQDPEIRERFQFLYYAYPSATPVVPSAAMLKNHLDTAVNTIEEEFGISMERRLIVVGHSMGGILAKSLISDSGDRLWDTAFKAPVSAFDLTPGQRSMLSNAFRYEPRSYVNSVIFLASPQRGSYLATSFVGKIGARLSARPKVVDDLAKALTTTNKDLLQPEFASFVADNVNSISTLKPNSPVTNLLADLPIDKGVTYHTVAGVPSFDYATEEARDKGDGIVPLWSAELPDSRCEAGIVSGHGVHHQEETKKIVNTLLKVHGALINEDETIHKIKTLDVPFARYNKDASRLNIIKD